MWFRMALLCWFSVVTSVPAFAEGFTESWYMMRGRANMKIGNHKAAIEAFEKVAKENPDNREAMRTLGLAYSLEGLTDKAIGQFDLYLARFPDDPEIAFKQADYLSWSRYAFRRDDAIKYLKMGLKHQDDAKMRRKLARLLGQDRKNLDEAISEYRKLLAVQPDDEALRNEYRKLLLWDKKYADDAASEFDTFVKEHPSDFEASYQLAKLRAQDPDQRADAIALYSKLVKQRPADRNLRLEYARLLADAKRREADAVKQYDAALQKRDDLGVRIERADLLARRQESRPAALTAYKAILDRSSGNGAVRKRYAQLLLAERDDAAEAARQYEIVLERQPNDAEAHRGAAKAYAWLGQNDRALAHAQKATANEREAPRDINDLRRQLGRGREPRVGLRIENLTQPGGGYALQGLTGVFVGRRDLSPFSTLQLEAGYESFRDKHDEAGGGTLGVSLEYRFSETSRATATYGYHGLGILERKDTYSARFSWRAGAYDIEPGVKRDIVRDSLVSIAGRTVNGEKIGAARAESVFVRVGTTLSDVKVDITPRAGRIATLSNDENDFVGLDGKADMPWWRSDEWSLAGSYSMNFKHYDKDESGLVPSPEEPLAGGYFSPRFFTAQTPQLVLRYQTADGLSWALGAGPSLQYSETMDSGRLMTVSADSNLYVGGRVAETYDVELVAGYQRTPDVPGRIEAAIQVLKVF